MQAPQIDPPAVEGQADGQLTVQGLTKSWAGNKALQDVSFSQGPGSIYGIAGDNGAGKSTLLKILATVLPRDSGQVRFAGLDLDDRSRWRRVTGYVPQELALDERLQVRETLNYWAAARGFTRSQRRDLLDLAYSDPLIADFLKKKIRECSGGMARRVSLIVGLLGDPPLLLLDEPFAGADQASRDLILGRLDLLRSRGRTILVSSHQTEILDQLCDRVLTLRSGRLTAAGPGPV